MHTGETAVRTGSTKPPDRSRRSRDRAHHVLANAAEHLRSRLEPTESPRASTPESLGYLSSDLSPWDRLQS